MMNSDCRPADSTRARSSQSTPESSHRTTSQRGGEASVAWWALKRDQKPAQGTELRAIVEIAMALHHALPPNPVRGASAPPVHAASITKTGRAKLRSARSRPTIAVGQARLLAPEVREGGVVDLAANLYCLGAMLFEAVTEQIFESGQQVREALNSDRARGRRAKGPRSRHGELLMLAARATFAEPAARGPDPRRFATQIILVGGKEVASPEALGQLVLRSIGGREARAPSSVAKRANESAAAKLVTPKANAVVEKARAAVVAHAPPISLTNPGEPARPQLGTPPGKEPPKTALAGDSLAPSAAKSAKLSEAPQRSETAKLDQPSSDPTSTAPQEVAGPTDGAPEPRVGESDDEAPRILALPAPSASDAPHESRVANEPRGRESSPAALLTVMATVLLLAIGVSIQLGRGSSTPDTQAGSAARVKSNDEASGSPARPSPEKPVPDRSPSKTRPSQRTGSPADAHGAPSPKTKAASPSGASEASSPSGRTPPDAASQTAPPKTRLKAKRRKEPDYGI